MIKEYAKQGDLKHVNQATGRNINDKDLGLVFVVQKHQASHLHYDFRLEMDGVLKSWVIPKGPSAKVGEKRLAIQVEDHPIEYGSFEGIIAKGKYGAGIVELWDQGTYEPIIKEGESSIIENLREGLKEGHLHFVLKGEVLNGQYALIKFKGSKNKEWLLVKTK